MTYNKSISPFYLSLSFGVTLFFYQYALSNKAIFFLLTMLLCVYLWLEVRRLRRFHSERWLLNPVVFASLVTFFIGFGPANLLFVMPEETTLLVGLAPEVTPEMVKLMWLVWLGAMAMWLGYWSPVARKLAGAGVCYRYSKRYFATVTTLRPWSLPVVFTVSLLARLAQIRLGVFGYSSNYERLVEMGSVTMYLSLGASLAKLALVIAALQFFSADTSRSSRRWFFSLLAYEVLFGLLSGFKSQVALPFVIVGICQYLRVGKVSKQLFIFFILGLFLAYAVIEPFRNEKRKDADFQSTSIINIASTMYGAVASKGESSVSKKEVSTALSILARSSAVYDGSLGIAYADANPVLPEGSPAFLADILMAPLQALIPRIIWENKSLGNIGLWYNLVVVGKTTISAAAMGPFTYLYFAGGIVAVFIGFFTIGIIQRLFFFLTQPTRHLAGGVIFLGMFSTVGNIDSSFNGIFVSLFRELPLLLLLVLLLFSRHSHRKVG